MSKRSYHRATSCSSNLERIASNSVLLILIFFVLPVVSPDAYARQLGLLQDVREE